MDRPTGLGSAVPSMRRPFVLLLLLALALLTAARAVGADGETVVDLEEKTLSLKERRALPYMRIAVGAGRDLKVEGLSRPVRFREEEDGLRAGRTLIRDGETFEVFRDDDGVRSFAILKGDVGRGDPSWWAMPLHARAGKIGREAVYVLDHDGDGTFLTPHRDLIVRRRGGEIFPVAEHVVLDREVYRMTYDEAKGRIAWRLVTKEYATPDVFPNWTGVARGLARLNEVRAGLNLPPVGLDRDASRRALLHLRYCSINGGNPHVEEPDKRGYTEEGAEAGINSIGWMGGGEGVATVIEGHLASLLHRMDLIDPRKTAIGVATGSNRVWIHTECGEMRPFEGQGPSIFPATSWPVGVYAVDNPDPRPKGERQATGIPVTIAWFGMDEGVSKVRAELRSTSGKVDCLKNDADGRDLKTNAPQARAVLMARSPLTSGWYQLRATWLQRGEPKELVYKFRIGK